MYFDSHAHIASPEYDADREAVLAAAFSAGVEGIIEVGTDLPTCRDAIKLARQYDNIHAAAGIQPYYAGSLASDTWDILVNLLKEPKVKALGEIGLDYHYKTARDAQQQVFFKQLDLARDLGLPVSIHHRDAEKDMLKFIAEGRLDGLQGVFHCFSGSEKLAQAVVDKGFYISLAGQITFSNYKKTDLIKGLPLENLLIETDAPYLTPEPFRGRRYKPELIVHTAEKLARIHDRPTEEVGAITTANTRKLFNV